MPGTVPLLTFHRLLLCTLPVTYLLISTCSQQRCNARQLAAQNTTRGAAGPLQKHLHTYNNTGRKPSGATFALLNPPGALRLSFCLSRQQDASCPGTQLAGSLCCFSDQLGDKLKREVVH